MKYEKYCLPQGNLLFSHILFFDICLTVVLISICGIFFLRESNNNLEKAYLTNVFTVLKTGQIEMVERQALGEVVLKTNTVHTVMSENNITSTDVNYPTD